MVIEQLIYGANPETGQPGRYVLARSPGLSKDCAAEIVRLCEGWGGVPQDENFRPVLLSFPLEARMQSIPGQLFVVVQVSAEPLPIFHAAVISETDYNTFNCNPYGLALEDIYLKRWKPGLILERREIRPTSLAPLVSPLPSESDADLIDEALRQILSCNKLLLPLEINDEMSDRFLALILCALPLQLKRKLRFASLATSEVNRYNLATIYRPGNTVRNWHRLLMASLSGPVSNEMAGYLDAVRQCVVSGDLLGLEKISRQPPMDVVRKTDGPRPAITETLAATVTPSVPFATQKSLSKSDRIAAVVTTHHASPVRKRPARRATVRRRPVRRRSGRKVPGWVMAIFTFLLVAVGAAYWLSLDNWDKVSGIFTREEQRKTGPTLLGFTDVGALYDSELGHYLQADPGQPGPNQEKATAKALAVLKVGAAEDLSQQGHLFVDLVAQGIHHTSNPSREADRLKSLEQAGAVLELEMRRLQLAYYAIESGALWRDLSGLEERKIAARWDSLRRKQPDRLTAVATDLALQGQLADIRYARRQVSGMASLVTLFDQKTRDEYWTHAMEKAVKNLTHRSLSSSATIYRTCALDMAHLKKAEDAANFGVLAFSREYERKNWLPASIDKALASLRSDVSKYGRRVVPPLMIATVEFYATLLDEKLDWSQASPQQLSKLIKELDENRAVSFDPALYADHVDRVRIAALASLLERQHASRDLPARFFPDKDRNAAQSFLNVLGAEPSREEWQEMVQVTSRPFYARWVSARVSLATQDRARRNRRFDEAYGEVVEEAANLARLARQGQNWSGSHTQLYTKLVSLRTEYRGYLLHDRERLAKLQMLDELVAALVQPLSVAVTAVTVRLDTQLLHETTTVVVEVMDENGRLIQHTKPFQVGPAAPSGTGWVGTSPVAMELELRPGQSLRALVREATGGRTLLTLEYDGKDAVVPAALGVPRPGQSAAGTDDTGDKAAGSVTFKMTDGHWRQLKLPNLSATGGME